MYVYVVDWLRIDLQLDTSPIIAARQKAPMPAELLTFVEVHC